LRLRLRLRRSRLKRSSFSIASFTDVDDLFDRRLPPRLLPRRRRLSRSGTAATNVTFTRGHRVQIAALLGFGRAPKLSDQIRMPSDD